MILDGRFQRETALIEGDTGRRWSYAELRAEADALAETFPSSPTLAFCFCRGDAPSIVAYLACLRRGLPVVMLDAAASPAIKTRFVQRYRPGLILESPGPAAAPWWPETYGPPRSLCGLSLAVSAEPTACALHPDLSVLLSTSGTTGSPKLVRLSRRNIEANAESIARYLGLGADERAAASLPFFYSYGLSVLNSHLSSGGSLVLTEASFIRPEFWKVVAAQACSSLAGVPYFYQMLERVGFAKLALPALRMLTQAGGRLEEAVVLKYDRLMKSRGGRMVVMYGQTEATARMAYLPPEALPAKAGSVGVAIPGGAFSIENGDAKIAQPGQSGEIVYRGPNVMLGYAESPEDLALGDELGGALRTGDLGHLDADGFLYVTGRMKRFSKIFGLRINLDEVERKMRARGPAAVVGNDEKIVVYCEYGDPAEHETLRRELAALYKINLSAFELRRVPALPLKASGKVDYESLRP